MVGPRLSGLSAERVNYLRRKGLLTKEEAERGYRVRVPIGGRKIYVSPWDLAVIMGIVTSRSGRRYEDVEKAWKDVLSLRGSTLTGWLKKAAKWILSRFVLQDPAMADVDQFFTDDEQAVADAAASRAADYIRAESVAAEDNVQRQVQRAIAEGWDAEKLAAELARITQEWDRDWRRMARTELQGAYNEAVAQNAIFTEGPNAQVARVPEQDACESCMRLFTFGGKPIIWNLNDLIANGTNIGRKRSEWRATLWPIHPNCFPAGTKVGTRAIEDVRPGDMVPDGRGGAQRVQSTWTTAYRGDLLRISLSNGASILTTPGHPLDVQGRGFTDASAVDRGDFLCEVSNHAVGSLLRDLDAQSVPSEDREPRRFASILSGLSRCGVPVSAVYFNGEFYVGEGDVYQKPLHLIAWRRVEPVGLNSGEHALLVPGLEHPGPSSDHPANTLLIELDPSHSVVCGANERVAFLLRQLRPSGPHSRTLPPLGEPLLPDVPDYDIPRHAEDLCYLFYRAQFVEVEADNTVNVEIDSAGHASTIEHWHKVVNVARVPYDGLVYNLTVGGDSTYTAEGFRCHNCRCGTIVVPFGYEFDEEWNLRLRKTDE